MSQINLDTSPYFDDFDPDKDFYKVLFKPGFPVQARELTTLQSILQNQVSSFGEYIFKEGSMVIPGAISYNPQYTAVILEPQQGGIDISLYLDKLVGKTIRGSQTGVRAKVIDYLLPPQEGVVNPTIFVTYTDSGSDESTVFFSTTEPLINEQPVVYGNTTITAGSIFGTTVTTDATAVGSAAEIADGVYFIRGYFAQVDASSIVLEPYVNTPSYRVGLQITEQIITAGQDPSLYDNAKGFNNFSAPGADRLKIKLTLVKKALNDLNDVDFVELLRVEFGEVKKLEEDSQLNLIRDYLAKRTFDESGDYIVNGFQVGVDESLNDNMGNGGIYNSSQKTEGGSDPSDELAIVKVSSGTAYVQGYDIRTAGTVNLDAPKARTVETVESSGVPFEMGSQFFVNNVTSTPVVGLDINDNIVELYNGRLDAGKGPTGTKVGEARVYSYSLEDSPYQGDSTPWNLYLYDFQIFTRLKLNRNVSGFLSEGFRVRGLSSNATGIVRTVQNSTEAFITEVSGNFVKGEQISVNGQTTNSIATVEVEIYRQNQVKSVFQNTTAIDPNVRADFSADTRLYPRVPNGFTASDSFRFNTSTQTISCPGRIFSDFNVGDVVIFQVGNNTAVNYAEVIGLDSTESSIEVAAIANVNGVCLGSLPTQNQNNLNLRLAESRVLNTENSFLYCELEENNISKVNLANSALYFTTQITGESVNNSELTIVRTDTGVNDAIFTEFDQERYSIIYNDGEIEPLSGEQVTLSANSDEVTFAGLSRPNAVDVVVNVTAIKPSIKSKVKVLNKSKSILIDKISTDINAEFDMTQNDYYGLRVDDEEISLNVADVESVTAIYESLDSGAPTLDTLLFVNGLQLDANTIKGELIVGNKTGAVAKLFGTPTPSNVTFVYMSQTRFEVGERLVFQESNIQTNLQGIQPGNYNDITDKYNLDKGQREQFYDYSRIVRKRGVTAPNKKLLVIFDQFVVPEDDKGDFYTANSYVEEVFNKGVPLLKNGTLRASDTLDFRPRVANFTSNSASPFAYTSRDFATSGSTVIRVTAPNESMIVGYDFYVGRKDRLILNKDGQFSLVSGAPAALPQLPASVSSSMEIAQIEFPPYTYNVDDVIIVIIDNKRFTMRDIGKLEDRIEVLEELTSLSLLEAQTETLQVLDADGNNRFKSGFFADDFRNAQLIDFGNQDTSCAVRSGQEVLQTRVEFSSLQLVPQLQEGIDVNSASFEQDLPLVDSSTKKTGDLITLDYRETEWIKQSLASRVENVNPFNVILYQGSTLLNPRFDDFVETITLDDQRVNVFGESPEEFGQTFVEGIETATFMRERNVSFETSDIRPHTRFYPFFEGSTGIDFIPKLIEITMQNGIFEVGETVTGRFGSEEIFSARVAAQNHKIGPFNAPTRRYTNNPYNRELEVGDSYSSSSSVLNIDTNSLSDISDSRYQGFIFTGMRLVGSSSGAIAEVTNLKLVSDGFGELLGCLFFRNPYETPAPQFRLRTGIRTFRLTSSPTNETPALGETIISYADASYESSGTVQSRRTTTINIRELPPPPPPIIIDRTVTNNFTEVIDRTVTQVIDRTVTNNNTIVERIEVPVEVPIEFEEVARDPLAQTFRVDETGAFLVSVDIFLSSKSDTDNLTVEIRGTELGTPLGGPIQDFAQVVLSPDQINVSSDASVPTNVKFRSPIYLEPDITYAVVLLAPTTNDYNAWIARMGEENIEGENVAAGGSAVISQQYLNGSLFRSQNGSIWTANQFEDLKFTLYKASFAEIGTLFLNNPRIFNQARLANNPIQTLPRKISVFVDSTSYAFTEGQVVTSTASGQNTVPRVTGNVEAVGGPNVSLRITDGGIGYPEGGPYNVDLVPISTTGVNARASITVTAGQIDSISVLVPGTGYRVGDTLTIDVSETSEVKSGGNAVIAVETVGDTDTVFLTNVVGEKIIDTDTLREYDSQTIGSIISGISKDSEITTPMNNGSVFVINVPSHGMMADPNFLTITGVLPDTSGTPLVEGIDISSNLITVSDPSLFETFEGLTGGTGYLLVGGEIIEYIDNGDGTLGITGRGVDNTIVNIHDQGERVFKYELSGVSLRRINTVHQLPTDQLLGFTRDFDTLPIEIDRSPREIDTGTDEYVPQLNFNQEQSAGANSAFCSQNFQFNEFFPSIGLITPGNNTSIDSVVRTVSGTSAGGRGVQPSFIEQPSAQVDLNAINTLDSPRLLCSEINEINNLVELPQNKSFTLALTLRSSDKNLSPAIDIGQLTLILLRNVLNNPVEDYASDPRTNQLVGDPHSSIYISNRIDLENPATSLKVLASAYRDQSADFRVCYRLFGADSQGSTDPGWVLFPGYDNLLDTDGDGFGDRIIDPSRFSGLPDKQVRPSRIGVNGGTALEFLEYEYNIDNLPEFSGFQIKIVMSGTNEARSPAFSDVRYIALA